ncbi:hypothetical protein ACVW1C_000214 [Bradyrhizobium sp. USDA 4011]
MSTRCGDKPSEQQHDQQLRCNYDTKVVRALRYNALKSSGTSPNVLTTLASLNYP